MVAKYRKRRQLFVDPKVQGALILRVVLYWIVCLTAITLVLLCWRVATGPVMPFAAHFHEMWIHFGPAVLVSLLLVPVVAYDVVQMSNRFCGPLFRLRRCLRALGRGEHVDPISFRDGDFWPEFAQEFNVLLARVQRVPLASVATAAEEKEEKTSEPAAV
jgi:hypothetical protein